VAHTDLRARLGDRPCFGTVLKIPRPEVADLLAIAGFDFVICDMEHAQVSELEARVAIKACVANDLPVIVRLPDLDQGIINRLFEAGATGIQMSRLRTKSDARQLFALTHFPPLGVRSVGQANPRAGYGSVPLPTYVEDGNARIVLVGQFETREVEQPIDAAMEGLDVAFIGPVDLSVDFGVPGQADHPEVVARIRDIEAAATRTGTAMGAFVGSVERALELVARGYRYLAVSGDISILGTAAKAMIAQLRAGAS